MFCRKCGKEIHDEAVVCIHCGCDTNGERTSSDKYCKICGKEITEDQGICMGCGCSLPVNVELEKEEPEQYDFYGKKVDNNQQSNNDKSGIGFVMAFFLGIIGLIIGLCLYPSGSFELRTFLKGWTWTFVGVFIAAIVIVIIVLGTVSPSRFRY